MLFVNTYILNCLWTSRAYVVTTVFVENNQQVNLRPCAPQRCQRPQNSWHPTRRDLNLPRAPGTSRPFHFFSFFLGGERWAKPGLFLVGCFLVFVCFCIVVLGWMMMTMTVSGSNGLATAYWTVMSQQLVSSSPKFLLRWTFSNKSIVGSWTHENGQLKGPGDGNQPTTWL